MSKKNKTIIEILLEAGVINKYQADRAVEISKSKNIDVLNALIEHCGADNERIVAVLNTIDSQRGFLFFLKDREFITSGDFDAVFALYEKGHDVEKELLATGSISEEEMAQKIAEYGGYAAAGDIEINQANVDKLYKIISRERFKENASAPCDFNGSVVTVLAAYLKSAILIKNIIENQKFSADVRITTASRLLQIINVKKSKTDDDLKKEGELARKNESKEKFRETPGAAGDDETLELSALAAEERPVVRLLNTIIYNAIEKNSSDIHFEIYKKTAKVKFRIDGVLHEIMKDLPYHYFLPLISRIKIMAKLDISEHRTPQDGRFQLKIDGRDVDFRVSILPAIFGETAVVRILNQQALSLELPELGFGGDELKKFLRSINMPYGMVLVSGPTGSGKTTTLYGAIKTIMKPEDKIITIEDPVEYQITDVVQVPVNEKKGLTFARGLRSIVRQDPDKIMVGEIRDAETADIAVNAALTGHLVFSTIHANNVIDTISRLLNLGIEPYQFAASFNMIIAQRLVRKLCQSCIIEAVNSGEYFELKGKKTFISKGCQVCSGIGFKGRIAIFEMLELDDKIRQMIIDRVSPLKIRDYAVKNGMKTLRKSAVDKVINGITSMDEINRVTFEEK